MPKTKSQPKSQSLQELHPSQDLIRARTLTTLSGQVGVEEVLNFLDLAAKPEAAPALGATASANFGLIWGVVKCEPHDQPWIFDHQAWGVGAASLHATGFMYTGYTSWDAFFRNVTSFHVQGAATVGGILQINWFREDGAPVGQFNGVALGEGVVEAGGPGTWKKK